MRIAVAIPCYKVTQHVLCVIAAIGPEVETVYAVDDACPDGSGRFIEEHNRDPRVRVMPAHGLSLEEVVYPADADLASRADMARSRRELPAEQLEGAPDAH